MVQLAAPQDSEVSIELAWIEQAVWVKRQLEIHLQFAQFAREWVKHRLFTAMAEQRGVAVQRIELFADARGVFLTDQPALCAAPVNELLAIQVKGRRCGGQ